MFFSNRKRHTTCLVGTVIHTCALPIWETLRISLLDAIAPLLVNALTDEFIVRHPAISLGISVTDRHVDLARDGFDFMLALGETRKEGATTCLSVNLPVALAAAPTYLAQIGRAHV